MRRIRVMWLVWFAVLILSRLVPHLPNLTPLSAFSVLATREFSKASALVLMLIALLISNLFLSLMYQFPLWGGWLFFMITGYSFIVLASSYFKLMSRTQRLCAVMGSAGFYWLWSNFGVWLLGGVYSRTTMGLLQCYTLALPFLATACAGSLIVLSVYEAVKCVDKWSFLSQQSRVEHPAD